MLSLDADYNAIISKIDNLEHRDFLIILKTKNEEELLEEWIEHYAAIFGYDSLLVLDNLSDNEAVHQIYDKYKNKLGLIASFGENGGGHNLIHYPESNAGYLKFYQAIEKKCLFFGLFDTDEFLVYLTNNKILTGKDLGLKLTSWARLNKNKVLHCYWLNSLSGSDNKYFLGNSFLKIFDGVKKGKYFMPSQLASKYPNGHNSCSPIEFSPDEVSMNFWLLHRQSSSPIRRIKINFEKISARKMFKLGVTLKDVISKPDLNMLLHKNNGPCNAYMQQILNLSASKDIEAKNGWLEIKKGKIFFSDEKHESLFLKFIKNSTFRIWITRYFKSKYSCSLNKQPMIDIGVYGELDIISIDRISGWIVDTVSDEIPFIAVKLNGEVLLRFNPINYAKAMGHEFDRPTHFDIQKDDLKILTNKIEGLGKENIIEVIFTRTNKRLRNGHKKIDSIAFN